MNNETVYLTFKTDRATSVLLSKIAHKIGKTQPEFINEICQHYIKAILEDLNSVHTEKTETGYSGQDPAQADTDPHQ